MGCHFLNQAGEDLPIVMGCYGIGVSRVLAAAIEQNHDQDGIIWPDSIAPYTVTILALQADSPAVVESALKLYQALQQAGIDAPPILPATSGVWLAKDGSPGTSAHGGWPIHPPGRQVQEAAFSPALQPQAHDLAPALPCARPPRPARASCQPC